MSGSFTPLTRFITRDLTAALVASNPPSDEVRELANFSKRKFQLIIGTDANSRHEIWGCTDTRERGKYLLEYLIQHDLEINNRGCVPTYRHEG